MEELQADAGNLAERNCTRERGDVPEEIGYSLTGQSLVERRSFLEKFCRGREVMLKDLYSIFTSESLRTLYLGVSSLLKTC